MEQAKWDEIVEKITSKFNVLEHGEEPLENNGKLEFYEFDSPLGRLRLERKMTPKLLDKKTTYSNRIGSSTSVEYVFSQDEFVDRLIFYRWDDSRQSWQEIDSQGLI